MENPSDQMKKGQSKTQANTRSSTLGDGTSISERGVVAEGVGLR